MFASYNAVVLNLFRSFSPSSEFQQPSFPFVKCDWIPLVLCKTPEQFFCFHWVSSQSIQCLRCKYKISISFHSMETTNVHLFLAGTDMKSQSTLMSVKNYNLSHWLVPNCQVHYSVHNTVTVASCQGVTLEYPPEWNFPPNMPVKNRCYSRFCEMSERTMNNCLDYI